VLKELNISNYVLIKKLVFNPDRGLTTITGETGAGKSILIGALGLILGKRAEPKFIQDSSQKCIVEGHFDLSKLDLESFFLTNDLDFDSYSIIRREILPNGRSRAFINDTPVSLQVLKDLGEKLVDVHSQNENLSLKDNTFLFDWLDALSNCLDERIDYEKSFHQMSNTIQHLEMLKEAQARGESERDYWQFLFDELLEAEIQPDEMDDLESKLDFLSNAEAIQEGCINAYNELDGEESNIIDRLNSLIGNWPSSIRSNPSIQSFIERLQSGVLELKDLASELRNMADQPAGDTEELKQVEDRMAVLHVLLRKHQVQNIDKLIKIREDLDNKLQLVDNRQHEIDELQQSLVILELSTRKKAKALHEIRLDSRDEISSKINADLKELGLPNSQIKLDIELKDELDSFGMTDFRLLFSANKGSSLELVQKVASGGETSRLMLVIKSHLARYKQLPTIIFDEIDTGVSGEVAKKMGEMMHSLSQDLQVVSITHLPQIASKGDAHFFVYKTTLGDSTTTDVRSLKGEERVMEIAKMLSGEHPSEAAKSNARELLSN